MPRPSYGHGAETRTTYGTSTGTAGKFGEPSIQPTEARQPEFLADTKVEHIDATTIAVAAANPDTLHLLSCTRCARLVIDLAASPETTPFNQFPSEY